MQQCKFLSWGHFFVKNKLQEYTLKIFANLVYGVTLSLALVIKNMNTAWRTVSEITAWKIRWTGLPMVWRPDRDCLVKDNLSNYCLKTFEMAEGKKGGAAGSSTLAAKPEALGDGGPWHALLSHNLASLPCEDWGWWCSSQVYSKFCG